MAEGYSYGGEHSTRVAHGIRATLVSVAPTSVTDGLLAAWVGVGGPGKGAGDGDVWLQVGFATFTYGVNQLYFEVNRQHSGPWYTELRSRVPVGARFDVAVLEVSLRPDWWRVWVNGTPASNALYLPDSGSGWRPTATVEAWHDERVCDEFAYRFDHVEVAAGKGGAWTPLVPGAIFEDSGYRVESRPGHSLLVASA